jgi:hypothetical protein
VFTVRRLRNLLRATPIAAVLAVAGLALPAQAAHAFDCDHCDKPVATYHLEN